MSAEPFEISDVEVESSESGDEACDEDLTLNPSSQTPSVISISSSPITVPLSPVKSSGPLVVSRAAKADDSVDKKETPAEGKVIVQQIQKAATPASRPVGASVGNGIVAQRKVGTTGGPNITYVTPVWGANKTGKTPAQAVVWTAVSKGGKFQRVLIPSNQTTTQGTPVTSTSAGSWQSSANVVLNQGNKPMQKTFTVVKSNTAPTKVNVVPRSAVYVDGQGNSIQTKFIATNSVKLNNGRFFTNTPLRQVGVLSSPAGKVISSSGIPSGCNVVTLPGTPRFSIAGKMGTVLTSGDKKIVIAKPAAAPTLKVAQDPNHKVIEIRHSNQASAQVSTPATVMFNTPSSTSSSTQESARPTGLAASSTNVPEPSTSEEPRQTESSSGRADNTTTEYICIDELRDGATPSNTEQSSEPPVDPGTGDSSSSDGQMNAAGVKASSEQIPNSDAAVEVADASDHQLPSTKPQEHTADGPPEKKSATWKAKILSFPKSKTTNSLLNGLIDRKPEAPPATSRPNESGVAVERVRKRKDNHKPVGGSDIPQKLLRTQESIISIKPLPYAEITSPLKVIKWDGIGLGLLPGSTLRFVRNEYGMLEVHEPLLAPKVELYKDPKDGETKVKKRDPSEIFCCILCSCYGLLSEFYNETFCSLVCSENMNLAFESICRKLVEEPLILEAPPHEAPSRKRSKTLIPDAKIIFRDSPDSDEEPPGKKKRKGEIVDTDDNADSEDKNEDDSKTSKPKAAVVQTKQETSSKPLIKVKSMDILAVSGRQLRTKDSVTPSTKKNPSKYITNQDLEGINSDDDDKLKFENMDPFPWPEYLLKTRSKAAWVKLFNNPFPSGPNPFKIGFKLEAIDPERQKLICAATVADVQGYRIKVHFDGYSNKYDFWTNIDSPNIFFCGFSAQHGIELQPPCGFKKSAFNWDTYHTTRKSRPASLSWFQCQQSKATSTNMFRAGMKLEAVDRKNTQLTCVATVAGVLENRILVHFDSWSDVYDYWVDTSSPYIHPVGWCAERNRELTPPNYYNPETFSWEAYLIETKSEAAPAAAFTLRRPIDFKRNTKLEAIDKRAPHLLRVATIKDVLPYQVKIAFDGFPEHFGYWVDDDSPDIHPVSWGHKTGHPLTAPPDEYDFKGGRSKCPTPGCVGDGNFQGLLAGFHSTVEECPYSLQHLSAESPLQDRLSNKGSKKKSVGQDEEDSDGDDPDAQWKFMDLALEMKGAKSRVSSEGTVVFPAKQSGNSIHVPPDHQTFKPPSKAVIKSNTGQILHGGSDCKADDKNSFDSGSVTGYDKRVRRKSTDKPDKPKTNAGGRRSIGTTQTGQPPVRSSRMLEDSELKKYLRIEKEEARDVMNKMRATPQHVVMNAQGVLTWGRQQCRDKIAEKLPTKVRSALKKLDLDGGRMMMLNTVMDRLLEELLPSEAKALFTFLTTLYTEATTDLSVWKKASSP